MRKDIYISVDIEANGPIPGEYSMVEVGAYNIETEDTFSNLIKPLNDQFEQSAMNVIKYDMDSLFVLGDPAKDVMERFSTWVKDQYDWKTERPVFVGFNAGFDWMFTNWYFLKFLSYNPFGINCLDVKSYYAGKTGCCWSKTTKRNMRPKSITSGLQHTHEAVDDAKEQGIIFKRIMEL